MRPIKPKEMLEFSHGGMLKFKYKGRSLTIKLAIENPNGESMPYYLCYMYKKQNLKKSKISILGEFLKFLRFNGLWADFENK